MQLWRIWPWNCSGRRKVREESSEARAFGKGSTSILCGIPAESRPGHFVIRFAADSGFALVIVSRWANRSCAVCHAFLQIIPPVSMCIFGIPVEYIASVLYAEGTEHLSSRIQSVAFGIYREWGSLQDRLLRNVLDVIAQESKRTSSRDHRGSGLRHVDAKIGEARSYLDANEQGNATASRCCGEGNNSINCNTKLCLPVSQRCSEHLRRGVGVDAATMISRHAGGGSSSLIACNRSVPPRIIVLSCLS